MDKFHVCAYVAYVAYVAHVAQCILHIEHSAKGCAPHTRSSPSTRTSFQNLRKQEAVITKVAWKKMPARNKSKI